MRPKRDSKQKAQALPASPLDAKRRALAEQEAKLQTEIARRTKLIEDAPKIAREQEQRRREEIVKRASRTEARYGTRAALQDPRHAYEANVGTRRVPRLKSERRQGMLTFFVLCLVLAAVLFWLYYTVLRDV